MCVECPRPFESLFVSHSLYVCIYAFYEKSMYYVPWIAYYQRKREVETSCINLIVGDRLTEEKKKKKTLFTGSLKAENTTKVKVGPYSGFI